MTKDKMPLRRHRDDDYWDRILISAGDVRLAAHLIPRYKTSGLSGDEWRVHAELRIADETGNVLDERYHRIHKLTEYSPFHIWNGARHLLDTPRAELIAFRKNIELTRLSFPVFGDAALGMGWHILIANENGAPWRHLTDAEERERCQQPGCADSPRNFYRYKALQISPSESDMVAPKYEFQGQFTWYCARHSQRGDCGLEDADKNLILVGGNGLPITHEQDESPSAFGGVFGGGEP